MRAGPDLRRLLQQRVSVTALAWAHELGDALLAPPPLGFPGSLMNGEPGIALFLAYLGQRGSDPRYTEGAERLLDEAFALAGELGPFLHDGFTGAAWTLEHLAGRVLAPSEGDPNEDCDAAVAEVLARPVELQDAGDLMFGAAGLAVYLLERGRDPSSVLGGAAGVGLVLLDLAPGWDRIFLTDLA